VTAALTTHELQVLDMEARAPARGWHDARIWDELRITAASYYQTLAAILTDDDRRAAAEARDPTTVARLLRRIKEGAYRRHQWITGRT
jgi:Protein of unknown function (DUF3263)